MPTRIHIDREEELRLFDDVLAGRRAERILLLEGSSQTGKSSLLSEFGKRCGVCHWALVNFKDTLSFGAMQFLGELADTLSPIAFDQFRAQCAQMAASATVTITGNRLIGSKIDVALGQLDDSQRQARYTLLTGAFFADLRQSHQQVVMAIDTFEQAANEVRAWISGILLPRAHRTPGVVIVIAGQSVPVLDREWDEHCCHHHLSGLQREFWYEYFQRTDVTVSRETAFAFHQLFDGIPGEMEKVSAKLKGGVQ
jgi:hypothetical protein